MKTIILNYLWIFGLPLLIGIVLRVLLNRLPKPYLVTAVLGIIQATTAFAASFVTGLVLNYFGHY